MQEQEDKCQYCSPFPSTQSDPTQPVDAANERRPAHVIEQHSNEIHSRVNNRKNEHKRHPRLHRRWQPQVLWHKDHCVSREPESRSDPRRKCEQPKSFPKEPTPVPSQGTHS